MCRKKDIHDRASIDFFDLASSREFRDFFNIIRELTGIYLVLTDPEDKRRHYLFDSKYDLNPFCDLIRSCPDGNKKCLESDHEHLRQALEQMRGFHYFCHAGLVDIVVPIYAQGSHIATFIGGQLLAEAPSEKNFYDLMERLKPLPLEESKIRELYFKSPHMPEEKINSAIKLITFFAEYVFELGSRLKREESPQSSIVREADEFIRKNAFGVMAPITLESIAKHVSLSPAYLSSMYHKVSGKRLSSQIQEERIEHAKKLLEKTDDKIIDIAFASGFGSLTHFNRVFKQITEMTPKVFRNSVR